jgi:hypothetical protein
MLVLHHVSAEVQPEISIDEYVPLSVEVPGERSPLGVLYWRLKPEPTTLMEVGVCEGSGRLQSITLTALAPRLVAVVGAKPLLTTDVAVRGVPCFDLCGWAPGEDFGSRFRDEFFEPRLVVGAAACGLDLGTHPPPVQAICFGTVRCLFSAHGQLVRVEVDNLHESEERILCSFAL